MNPAIAIRNETAADVGTITGVTAAAFKTLEISSHTEQFIVEALRVARADAVAGRSSRRPRRRTNCILPRDHVGRHHALVRARAVFLAAMSLSMKDSMQLRLSLPARNS